MPFVRSTALLCRRGGPITRAYRRRVESGSLSLDDEQLSLGAALDSLHSSLTSPRSARFLLPDDLIEEAARHYASPSRSDASLWGMAVATAHSFVHAPPKGIYVHGSVGVGKSMLMDLFYHVCDNGWSDEDMKYAPLRGRRRRCHFHEFMLDVHQRIHAYKAEHPRADPIPPVAAALAREARLLCFDEMQITDIADAMIMKRLLTLLFDLGVVVVTTSNRPPCGLYEGGINRSVFLPFIDTLRERMSVIEMGGTHDYRRDGLMASTLNSSTALLPTYLCQSANSSTRQILELWFSKGGGKVRSETVPVAMGRFVNADRANDSCVWFSFEALCHQPLGAADYIAIGERFDTVIVEGVPQLGGNTYNEARRFVTMVDALYEARTKLILASEVQRDELFVGFDAAVESHDGDEEIAVEGNNGDSYVIGEGGSSSSHSTTMFKTRNGEAEWSATGRIGVSLAQLSAVKEVSFSFRRAESRLAEMASPHWGR